MTALLPLLLLDRENDGSRLIPDSGWLLQNLAGLPSATDYAGFEWYPAAGRQATEPG